MESGSNKTSVSWIMLCCGSRTLQAWNRPPVAPSPKATRRQKTDGARAWPWRAPRRHSLERVSALGRRIAEADEHVKRCSTPLVIRMKQTKPSIISHFAPFYDGYDQKDRLWQEPGRLEGDQNPQALLVGMHHDAAAFENGPAVHQVTIHVVTIDSDMPLPAIYLRERKIRP